jgi:hypothetical protein
MTLVLPEWFKDMTWPDGVTVGELRQEPQEILLQPGSKKELQAVWRQRLKDAVSMGNEPWKARSQAICDWLATADDDLRLLILGSERRSMLIDMHHRTALAMSHHSSTPIDASHPPPVA